MGYGLGTLGQPVIDENTCIGCGQCEKICPDEILTVENGKARPGRGIFMGCIACGHCVAVCPQGCIRVTGRGMAADDRIDLPPAAAKAGADPLEALMVARRSVRRFKPQEVPREQLERIVSMASTAPMGLPPSDVGVVVLPTPRHVQEFSADACASFEKMAKMFNPVVLGLMRPLVGKVRYETFRDFIRPLMKMLPAKRREGRDLFTYDAPAALVFHYGPMSDVGDAQIVCTYAMLAAESLGLGNCMLGTSVALSNNKRFKAKYGIPAENKVGVTLIVGHPASTFRHAIRRRLGWVKYVE
jgi:ferredoxin